MEALNNDLITNSEAYRMITHMHSNGNSHSFIDQSLTTTSQPILGNVTISNTSVLTNNSVITKNYVVDNSPTDSGSAFLVNNMIGFLYTDNTTIEISSNQLSIVSGIAGAGLTGGTLGVPLSVVTDNTSLEIDSNQIRLASGAVDAAGGILGGSGTTLSVNVDNNSLEIDSNQIRLASGFVGNGLTGGSGTPLSVVTDNSSLEIDSNQIRLGSGALNAAGGILGGSGTTLSVNVDNNSLEINANQIRLASGFVGSGLTGGSGTPLSVNVDNTSLEIDSNQIRLASGALNAAGGILGGSGTTLSVNVDNNSLEIDSNQIRLASGFVGSGLTGGSGTPLSVVTDNTSLEVDSNQVRLGSGALNAAGGILGGSGTALSVNVDNNSLEINSNQLRLASGFIGSGLSGGSGTPLSVGAGTGIVVGSDISTNTVNSGITTVGTLNDLSVFGSTTLNSNLVVSGDTVIQGNLTGNGLNIVSESLTTFDSILGGINEITEGVYYANTIQEVNEYLSTAVSGDTVQLAPHTFLFEGSSNTFVVPDGVNVKGYKGLTKLRRDSTNTNIRIYRLNGNSVISDQIVDCNYTGNSLAAGEGPGSNYATVYLENTRNITFKDVEFEDIGSKSHFFYTESDSGNSVYNITLDTITANNVFGSTPLINADGGGVTDLTLINSKLIDSELITLLSGSTVLSGNLTVKYNELLVDTFATSSGIQLICSDPNTYVEITDNKLKGETALILISAKRGNISRNKLTGYIILNSCENIKISDNLIKIGDRDSNYITSFSSSNCVISFNDFVSGDNFSYGLGFTGTNLDYQIISNTMRTENNRSTFDSLTAVGVSLDSNFYIQGNDFIEDTTNPSGDFAGFSNKYNITLTSSSSCGLSDLPRINSGHRLEFETVNISNGTTFTLTPDSFVSGTSLEFSSNGSSAILEWKLEEWEVISLTGDIKLTTTDTPIGVTNIDSVVSTNNETVLLSGLRSYRSNYVLRPNTTVTKSTFSFRPPGDQVITSNNDVVGVATGYSGSEGLNNMYIRGDATSGNVHCSFTSTGDSRNTDHIIQVDLTF